MGCAARARIRSQVASTARGTLPRATQPSEGENHDSDIHHAPLLVRVDAAEPGGR
jgi:hypothetical protein